VSGGAKLPVVLEIFDTSLFVDGAYTFCRFKNNYLGDRCRFQTVVNIVAEDSQRVNFRR
jgi:hypothetical protein